MTHKAWRSIEEVPCCFSRASIKFQGHRLKNRRFESCVRLPSRSPLSNPIDLPCFYTIKFEIMHVYPQYRYRVWISGIVCTSLIPVSHRSPFYLTGPWSHCFPTSLVQHTGPLLLCLNSLPPPPTPEPHTQTTAPNPNPQPPIPPPPTINPLSLFLRRL